MDPDAALGIEAGFDPVEFRNAIHFAMQMGTPPDPDMRLKFMRQPAGRTYWKDGVQLNTTPRTDRDGKPFDPDIEVRKPAPEAYTMPGGGQVDCAIEVTRADADELPVGNFEPTKLIITLLDEEYAVVKDCRQVVYNGDLYRFGYAPEALGLFSVGVNTMIFYAENES